MDESRCDELDATERWMPLVCSACSPSRHAGVYALEIAATGSSSRRGRLRAGVDLRFLQGAWPFGLVEAIWAVVACGAGWSAGGVLHSQAAS